MCVSVYVYRYPERPEELDAPVTGVTGIMNCLTQLLGIELGSPVRAVHVLLNTLSSLYTHPRAISFCTISLHPSKKKYFKMFPEDSLLLFM